MFIGYCRVSTERQFTSGLGLDAQREAITRYAEQQGRSLAQVFVEAESGKLKDRPQLSAALVECRRARATLLIAKLDRLARNVAFVSTLMETGVEFVAVDAPYANRLMIHILSAFAEHEREMISERTKAALRAAKCRGVRLGQHGTILARENKRRADDFAVAMTPKLEEALEAGCLTLAQIAAYMNDRGIRSARGGTWNPMAVSRLRTRSERPQLIPIPLPLKRCYIPGPIASGSD